MTIALAELQLQRGELQMWQVNNLIISNFFFFFCYTIFKKMIISFFSFKNTERKLTLLNFFIKI